MAPTIAMQSDSFGESLKRADLCVTLYHNLDCHKGCSRYCLQTTAATKNVLNGSMLLPMKCYFKYKTHMVQERIQAFQAKLDAHFYSDNGNLINEG